MTHFKQFLNIEWPLASKSVKGKQKTQMEDEGFFAIGDECDRRETQEDEFSVDIELEERLIRETARFSVHRDFNFAFIKSTFNEYSYLATSTPVSFDDEIYSFIDRGEILFIDSKKVCLANTLTRSIVKMFLKREIDKVSILSHTVSIIKRKSASQAHCDVMLLDLRRFDEVVPYLELFWTNLI